MVNENVPQESTEVLSLSFFFSFPISDVGNVHDGKSKQWGDASNLHIGAQCCNFFLNFWTI